jgi:glycosyltransferase involved in cell wall biosynthesis
MPTISVIIPIYNVEKYLRRCLDSVINQTFTDWEAICVNDGSPDNSAAILEEYVAKDKRFKVITKENGGLSDARNAGMAVATGKYLLFLDSDDTIHPQTMEFTYELAKKENADVVNFRKDLKLRTKLLVRKFLRIPTTYNDIMFIRAKKRYKLDRLSYKVTDDIIANATERSHRLRYHQVKHSYVWQNLYKRDLIKDIPFIKGIIMEDLPWWSEVMLARPRVVITRLPFYFYMPDDPNSIMASSKRIKKIRGLSIGIKHACEAYTKNATQKELDNWKREYMWPYIIWMFRDTFWISDSKDIAEAKEIYKDLYSLGILNDPKSCQAKRYHHRILHFINK